MRIVKESTHLTRADTFGAISRAAREYAETPARTPRKGARTPVPYVSEPWYCCAEPMESV
jgi:hypothetical protein